MPRGPRKLAIEFGATGLTHYGGVYLLHRFLSRVGFKDAIAREIRLAQRNNRYTVWEMLLALLYPILLGLDRIDTTQLLGQNGIFQYLTGLPSYPDATTLRRFLLRVAPTALPKLRALHDRFLHRMTLLPGPRASSSMWIPRCSWSTANRNKRALATTPSSEGDPPTTRCSASRARAETFGTGSCGPETPILPVASSTFSKPASPRFLHASDRL